MALPEQVERASSRERAGDAAAKLSRIGISAFGCDLDEAARFREVAPRLGVTPTITARAVSPATIELAVGNRCISVGHKTPISNESLRALSDAGIAYVSTRSSGHNHIDLDFARSVGITVEGVTYAPDGVADYTMMLMLMALRNARSIVTRAEAHDFRLNEVRGRELCELTVGVIGTGSVGTAVIERLHGFGGRVLAYDRTPKNSADQVSLDELLEQSDIVTLHTPLTPQTKHLLNGQRIEQMKPGAVVINTGRGALLDTAALVSALERGRLGGAALDVLEDEDGIFYTDRRKAPIENAALLRLQQLPQVLITPHTAYYTQRALRDTIEHSILNCLEFEGRQHD